jgi:hypothetical protein
MDGNVRVQSAPAGFGQKLRYWLSGGLIRDPRSAIYFLGMLTATGLFLVFYLWQVTSAYSAIQNNLLSEPTYFLLRGRILRGEAAGTWKTFVDDSGRFEFTYPANWTFDDRVAQNITVTPNGPRSLDASDELKLGDAWPHFRVTVYPNTRAFGAMEYYERVTAPRLRDDVEHAPIEVSLGGRSAVQYIELGITERRHYLVGSDTLMLELSYDTDPPSAFGDVRSAFEAMVRSFTVR